MISGKGYAYLRYREKGKHYTKYIGKVDSDEEKQIERQIIERKKIEELLKEAKRNYDEIVKLSKVVNIEG